MGPLMNYLRHSIVIRLWLAVAVLLLIGISLHTYFVCDHHELKLTQAMVQRLDLLSRTIQQGAHYAMMLNAREDINQIIHNVGRQPEILSLRIYSKDGTVRFSKNPDEVEQVHDVQSPQCIICHRSDPPVTRLGLLERTRTFYGENNIRQMAIASPIPNEPACSNAACHFHPAQAQVLGILDVVVSLENSDKEMAHARIVAFGTALMALVPMALLIYLSIDVLVRRPIRQLIKSTRQISKGQYQPKIPKFRGGEMAMLADAITQMGTEIGSKQAELNRQRNEYQSLFDTVPCFVTVQDQNYQLTAFNRKFADQFDPSLGDYCYKAYKGRTEKCTNCPVEKTFQDGLPHFSEEAGLAKDGTHTHWLVTTAPIRDEQGKMIAAMEMSLDITPTKQLEERVRQSEERYETIFNNIPNPVFVLNPESLEILNCNGSVMDLYGHTVDELVGSNFLELFADEDKKSLAEKIQEHSVLDLVRQKSLLHEDLYVLIRLAPMAFPDEEVLLAVISNITKRVEAEQQLVQAGKMATLGEMATGVAHELNQPLSVIKTASSFMMRKVNRGESIQPKILFTMVEEIDGHVDRAAKIINHMREFGRKSTMSPERVSINNVLQRAFDFFSQQLKLREIRVVWRLAEQLPRIKADSGRLEQVFINLLINARDSIEDRFEQDPLLSEEKHIILRTRYQNYQVIIEVIDNGLGVEPKRADKIFEPFFTTKRVGRGTGLGLSISYGIIKDSGGTIRAVEKEPPGACIEIRLPAPEQDT